MFRTENSSKCGVGTRVKGLDDSELWVIVYTSVEHNVVGALHVNTFNVVSTLQVEDPTWLSRREFDDLFEFKNYTCSDFTITTDCRLSCLERKRV